jgi:hypothetical protein
MDSEKAGVLAVGTTIAALEVRVNDAGTARVCFAEGWVSEHSKNGAACLERCPPETSSPQPQPQPQEQDLEEEQLDELTEEQLETLELEIAPEAAATGVRFTSSSEDSADDDDDDDDDDDRVRFTSSDESDGEEPGDDGDVSAAQESKQAKAAAVKARRAAKKHLKVLKQNGLEAFAAGDYDASIEALAQAKELAPAADPEVGEALSFAKFARRKARKAAAAAAAAAAGDEGGASAAQAEPAGAAEQLQEEAMTHFAAGRFAEAVVGLEQVLQMAGGEDADVAEALAFAKGQLACAGLFEKVKGKQTSSLTAEEKAAKKARNKAKRAAAAAQKKAAKEAAAVAADP